MDRAAAKPDGGCWTTTDPFGCCSNYPALMQTVQCNGNTCYPLPILNEPMRNLQNVVGGWLLSSMEHDTDSLCWVFVALCNEVDYDPPQCDLADWLEMRECNTYKQKTGSINCYIENP